MWSRKNRGRTVGPNCGAASGAEDPDGACWSPAALVQQAAWVPGFLLVAGRARGIATGRRHGGCHYRRTSWERWSTGQCWTKAVEGTVLAEVAVAGALSLR